MPTAHEIPTDALTALGVPARKDLGDEQQRGAACVWCRTGLDAETAVDLGEQPTPNRWFPRACPGCVTRQAWRGFLDHAMPCPRCSGASGILCATGRALNRLSKAHR